MTLARREGDTKRADYAAERVEALEATLAGRPVEAPTTRAVGCFIPDLRDPSS